MRVQQARLFTNLSKFVPPGQGIQTVDPLGFNLQRNVNVRTYKYVLQDVTFRTHACVLQCNTLLIKDY